MIALGSCTMKNPKYEELLLRPVTPIALDFDMTLIHLDDFLPDSIIADSVIIDGKKADFYQNQNTIMYTANQDNEFKPLIIMNIWANNKEASILLRKSEKQKYLYLFDPEETDYQSVELKGEFNGWTPSKSVLTKNENGIYGIMLLLNRGEYQYQIVLNGEGKIDKANPDSISNGNGGYNSLLSVGAKLEMEPVLWTESLEDGILKIKSLNHPEKILAFWNNLLIDSTNITNDSGEISIRLNNDIFHEKEAIVRVYSYNESGIGNDLYIPIENNNIKGISEKEFTNHEKVIYNVFVDRFYDGNKDNDWKLPDSIVLPPANYHGGDLAGITDKIKNGYFTNLGVNTLWLSPIIRNTEGAFGFWPNPKTKFSAYHGYWPVSFTKIDRHIGTPDEFKTTIKTAHDQNINLILDFVANHVHQEHPYYIAHPKSATQLDLPDGRKNLELWDEYRLTTWFDTFLPTLDLENEKTATMLADSIVWWAKEYNLDGFRYDAAKHIPLSFWHLLTDKLTDNLQDAADGKFYQLGETYGSAELISSYLGNGLLDAQFDFNLYDAAISAFAAGGAMNDLLKRLNESLRYYGSHHLMGNITGNQDRGRFISYAGGSLKFNENAKEAGWTREIEVGDSSGYAKLNMLLAFNMTIPGIPVIYYGDEFGMPGGNDPDCRRMMRFDKQLTEIETSNLLTTKKLIEIRTSSLALLYGDFCYKKATKNSLIYARTYFNDLAIAAFNNSNSTQEIEIHLSEFTNETLFNIYPKQNFVVEDGRLILTLAPYSYAILRNN